MGDGAGKNLWKWLQGARSRAFLEEAGASKKIKEAGAAKPFIEGTGAESWELVKKKIPAPPQHWYLIILFL